MTDKEELIRAAETLKRYCEDTCGEGCSHGWAGCLLYDTCDEHFIIHGGMCGIMENIIDEVNGWDE